MKKASLATAIALTLSSGTAMASADRDEVTHRLDVLPTVYGAISLAYEHNHTRDGVTGGKESFKDNESFIGVRHQHEIMPGLTAFGLVELWFDADQDQRAFDNFEYAYFGVEGDFGRVWAGTDDTVYQQQIDHIANFFQSEFRNPGEPRNIPGSYDTGRNNLLQYSSVPSNGWQFHGAVQINGDGDEDAMAEEGKSSRPFQLVSTYTSGNWQWAAGMDSNDGGSGPDNENTYGLRSSFQGEQFGMTAQYQRRDDVADVFGLLTSYTIGPNQFALSWERGKEREFNVRTNVYSAQVLHNLSEHLYLYVEGFQSESDRGTPHTRDLLIGATYHF
ncbi:MAG: porin [Halomonadaceae bacterium]|nr:MAG: porin [Halomonadaceae bacterium]